MLLEYLVLDDEDSMDDDDDDEHAVLAASKSIVLYSQLLYDKPPYHTSVLSGQGWIQEL
ncbi:hypothetical protein SERLADRAFT_375439, partial [Serpula lacrymans var. lacrymans S7.9]